MKPSTDPTAIETTKAATIGTVTPTTIATAAEAVATTIV